MNIIFSPIWNASAVSPFLATNPFFSVQWPRLHRPGRLLVSWPCIVFLLVFLLASSSYAADVKVLWNPNPENDIDHYTLRWGTESGILGENIQVPADQQETDADGKTVVAQVLKGLEDGRRYYFVVTAINTTGLESLPSDEIFKDFPLPQTPPSQPSMVIVLRIEIDSEGNITVIQE